MSYKIGDVAERFSLPVSTLRYYDKEGLFPHLERKGGQRFFSERDVELLKLIECLKKSGLEIKDIRQFILWSQEGAETYEQRYRLFKKQEAKVEEEIARMQDVRDMLRFKCWFYEALLAGEKAEEVKDLSSGKMPADMQVIYKRHFLLEEEEI